MRRHIHSYTLPGRAGPSAPCRSPAVRRQLNHARHRGGDGRRAAGPDAAAAPADSLRKRRATLGAYLETLDPASSEYDDTVAAIRELDVRLHARPVPGPAPAPPWRRSLPPTSS